MSTIISALILIIIVTDHVRHFVIRRGVKKRFLKIQQQRLQDNHKKFIVTETKLIEISKWIESEKAHHDLGEDYVFEWIKLHAQDVREAWDKSKCRICQRDCGHNLKEQCENYLPLPY